MKRCEVLLFSVVSLPLTKTTLWYLTNFHSSVETFFLVWPPLFSVGDQLAYNGPLPRDFHVLVHMLL